MSTKLEVLKYKAVLRFVLNSKTNKISCLKVFNYFWVTVHACVNYYDVQQHGSHSLLLDVPLGGKAATVWSWPLTPKMEVKS